MGRKLYDTTGQGTQAALGDQRVDRDPQLLNTAASGGRSRPYALDLGGSQAIGRRSGDLWCRTRCRHRHFRLAQLGCVQLLVGCPHGTSSDAELGGEVLPGGQTGAGFEHRSEEHTSELQSLMRISYAVFCLKKKKDR